MRSSTGGVVPSHAVIIPAALLVALAALLEASLSPLLTFGWVGPRFVVLGVVIAVAPLRELQALLLGFFGGVLTDALSGGIFGVGTLGGVFAAAISVRVGAARIRREAYLILSSGLAVAAYDLVGLVGPVLAGQNGPPLARYVVGGVIPDVLLNVFLMYLVGGRLLRLIIAKEER